MINELAKKLSPCPKSGLYEVIWSLTDACNLRCQYCYSDSKKLQKNSVNVNESKKIIEALEKLEVRIISFTGGEPLLNKDFFKIARLCRAKFRIIFLSTNGYYINKKIAAEIKECGIDSVQVSIDGPEHVHDDLCGVKGAFKKAMRAVVNLKSAGVDVAIAPTLTRQNINQLQYLTEIALSLDCDLSVKRVVLTGRGAEQKQLSITSDDYKKVYEYADGFNKQNKIHIFMHCDPLKFHLFSKAKKESLKNSTTIRGGCMAGIGLLYISTQKDIYPCSKLPISCGNLNKKSLDEIWYNSPIMKSLRERINLKGKCFQCEYANVCGGCRATAYETKLDLFDEDYLCWYRN